jgi:hypothetical protein
MRAIFFSKLIIGSVAELHHFYEALAPSKSFDAAPAALAPVPAPTQYIQSHHFENKPKLTLLHFMTFLIIHLCRSLSLELGPSEPEPHRITAPALQHWEWVTSGAFCH